MTSDDRRKRRGFRLTIRYLALSCAYLLVIYLVVYPADVNFFYKRVFEVILFVVIIPISLWIAWHLDFPARFRDRARELDRDPPEPKP